MTAVSVTITDYLSRGNERGVRATVVMSADYSANGDVFTAAQFAMKQINCVDITENPKGYVLECDLPNLKIKAYNVPAVTAHTHAVALDGGATGAEATHTHAVVLDTGTSGAGSSHSHAVALDSGTTANEEAHTHAVALDTGTSAAGSSHNHAFTASGVDTVFIAINTGADASASAQGTGENADQAAACSAADDSWRVDSAVAAGAWTVGALGAHPTSPRACVIQIENPTGGDLNLYEGIMTFHVTGTDYLGAALTEDITFTNTALNKLVVAAKFRWKYGLKAFKTITNVTLDNVPADALTICVGYSSRIHIGNPIVAEADMVQVIEDGTALSITGNVDTTNHTFDHGALAASKVVSYLYRTVTGRTGGNAAESTHTHGPGTLADAASGAGSAHSHGPGTLADAASGAEAAHTHGPGTLGDAASAAGSSHSHSYGNLTDAASGAAAGGTESALNEVDAHTDLSATGTNASFTVEVWGF